MTLPRPDVGVILVNYRTSGYPGAVGKVVSPLSERSRVFDHCRGQRSDDLATRLAALPLEVTYVAQGRNRGYASAVNVGWRALDEPYVLLLNPDAEISLTDIERMANVLDRGAGIGAVAPLHVDRSGTVTNPYRALPSWLDIAAERTHLYRFKWAKKRVRHTAPLTSTR